MRTGEISPVPVATKADEISELELSESVPNIVENLKSDLLKDLIVKGSDEQVKTFMDKIYDTLNINNFPKEGILETDLMHKLIPESIGKTGKELESYKTQFDDMLYIWFKSHQKSPKQIDEWFEQWKADHGYFEGR